MQTENDGVYEMDRASFTGAVATVIDAPPQFKRNLQDDAHLTTRNPLIARLLHWLYPEQRKAARLTVPNLIAFLGSIRTAQPYDIGDISSTGVYLITRERWTPDTVMPVTLLRTKNGRNDTVTTITLQSTVVRCGPDGVAFAFLPDERMNEKLEAFLEGLTVRAADEPDLMRAS